MMACPIVPPVHPELYTALCCVLWKHKTHNMYFLEHWSISTKLGIGVVDEQCLYIFCNIQLRSDSVGWGTLGSGVAVGITLECLSEKLPPLVGSLVPLLFKPSYSVPAILGIR